jgi:hypothetical protein
VAEYYAKMAVRMHIADKMRRDPRRRAVWRVIDLQIRRQALQPVCKKRVVFDEFGVGAPVLLSFYFVINVCKYAYMMSVPNKIGILPRSINFELVHVLDMKLGLHVDRLWIHAIIRTSCRCQHLTRQ